MSTLDPQHLNALKTFDTPTLLNAIELFDVRPRDQGFADGSLRALFPEMPPVVGYATTAKFRSSRPTGNDEGGIPLVDQVAHFLASVPEPRIVVFEDIDPQPVGATFGEVMCSIYKGFGCVGLITSGGARDVEQVRALGFPCWSSSVIASHAYCRIIEVGTPVTVGRLTIETGDLIHADGNGIAAVPKELVRELAPACQAVAEAENEVLAYLRSGENTLEGLRERCGRWKAALPNIPDRVRASMGEES